MATMQYVRYPTTGGGVGGITIGGTVTGGTVGSVLFVGAGPVLAQDNANFNFNDTTHALTITGPMSASNFSGSSSGTNTGDVTLGTANGLSLVGQVLSLGLSSTSTTGALSSTDWNTFNNGVTNAANRALSNLASVAINTALLPNATNSLNFGSPTFTWANGYFAGVLRAPTLVMNNGAQTLVTIDSNPVLTPTGISVPAIYNPNGPSSLAGSRDFGVFTQSGNSTNPTGSIHLETGNNASGVSGNSGDIIAQTGTVSAGVRGKIIFRDGTEGTSGYVWTSSNTTGTGGWAAPSGGSAITSLTGDVTATGPGAAAATIANNAVSNAKLAQMPTLTIKGNNTGGTANALDLTVAQVNAILPVFTSTLNGLVPFSGGGTTNFLRADGTWAVAGSGTVTSVALADSTGLFNITGSPVTTSGTLTLASFQSQAQNTFFAAPSGSAGSPTFRLIVAADVPTLNQNTTGTASNITASSNSTLTTLSALSLPGSQVTGNISGNAANVTGIVAIANGGTGSATQNFVDLTTNQTIAGQKQFSNSLTMTEIATPSTPAAGLDKLYVKSDGNLYLIGSNGVERIVGPGMSGSDWKNDLVFTFSASLGTVSPSNIWYRRVGDSMQIHGTFTAGTVTGSVPYIIMPSGYVLDTSKFYNSALAISFGVASGIYSPSLSLGAANVLLAGVYDGTNTDRIQFVYRVGGNSYQSDPANGVIATGVGIDFAFTVPIVGWSVNNGSNPPTPSMRAYGSSTTISSSLATINYTTVDYDNSSGYSAGTYTVPQAGLYQVNAALLVTGALLLNDTFIMEIQKNGTVVSRSTEYLAGTITDSNNQISDIINCALNDTIRIQVSSSSATPSIVSSNFDNYLSISKLN